MIKWWSAVLWWRTSGNVAQDTLMEEGDVERLLGRYYLIGDGITQGTDFTRLFLSNRDEGSCLDQKGCNIVQFSKNGDVNVIPRSDANPLDANKVEIAKAGLVYLSMYFNLTREEVDQINSGINGMAVDN